MPGLFDIIKKILLIAGISSFLLGYVGWGAFVHSQDAKEEESFFIARKAFDDGFYDVAIELFERFIKIYPRTAKFSETNFLIGQCYFHQNRYLNALGKFEEALSNPASKELKDAVFYWIAEVHFKGNAFTKAAKYYRMVVDNYPQSEYAAAAYYSLGWCLFQEAKYQQALEYFTIIDERFSSDNQFQDNPIKIAECLYNLKDYPGLKERIKVFLRADIKDSEKKSNLYFYLAEAEYYENNFSDALDYYAKAISLSGETKILELSKLGMAWSYLKLKKLTEAEEAFAQIDAESLESVSREIFMLGKAIFFFDAKRFTESKAVYEELLKSAKSVPVLVQGSLGLADVLYSLGDYRKSSENYKRTFEQMSAAGWNPQDIIDRAHYGLAWAYLKDGEFKQAIDEFQKLVKYTGDKIVKVSALCQIGDAYQDSGDFAKAQEAYDSILKDFPDSLYSDYVQYQLGLVFLKNFNYDGAILAFQTFAGNFPQSKLRDDAYYALGLAYFQRQDYNSSKDVFLKFKSQFKDSPILPQAIYLLATSYFNLGSFPEAIEAFKDIIRVYSSDAELVQKAEYEIADCYSQMGNEKEAMARFNTLRSKYPASKMTPEIIWWLGHYYYRQNNFDLARRHFYSLIRDFSSSNLIPSCYYALAEMAQEEGRSDEAVNNYKKVIETDSTDMSASAAIALATIYASQDKTDSALLTYREVLSGHNNLAHLVYPKMADIYRQRSQFKEALELYQKSLDMVAQRQMPDIQFKIAEVYQLQGEAEVAIQEYLGVTYLYSDNKDLSVKALLRVAQIYEDQEGFAKAKSIYGKIVSLEVPESKYAAERIEWIRANAK